ncbi:uncharacterized protein C8orf74 homolog isoform X2 [Fukomys damarensis]|uniref:uncharacterized protein C8orf74 homolog isoform X2 n=1 Tax=Fukomys damarensis TaxID=885580 RepID=UPI00053FF51F|nr:uncharacterized protein C8orf74 homolog isoform X2 [Fukomys damarensis]
MALLTPQGAREVFRLPKQRGREHLRRLLRWEELDELGDTRRSILLDALYNSVLFTASRGFPWVQVAQAVKFTEELLAETKGAREGQIAQNAEQATVTCPALGQEPPGVHGCRGGSITEAVTILGNKLRDYQRQFTTRHLLALCDYFHNTFIRHYRLYQYVLGQERDVHLTVTRLEVRTPPQPLPLAQGTHRDTWRHEQQVAALLTEEEQKRNEVQLLKEALRAEEARLLEKAFSCAGAPGAKGLGREPWPRGPHQDPQGPEGEEGQGEAACDPVTTALGDWEESFRATRPPTEQRS